MEQLSFWADVSVILLSCEAFVFMLIPGAIFYFAFRGLRQAEAKVREYSPLVQRAFRQANGITHEYADKIAAPVIKASAIGAQLRATGRRTTSIIIRRERQS
jgi:hypothetical protein